jgi:hypothetical protein
MALTRLAAVNSQRRSRHNVRETVHPSDWYVLNYASVHHCSRHGLRKRARDPLGIGQRLRFETNR